MNRRYSRGVNWSTLSAMQASPAHYRHRLLTPRISTPAMDLGRLIHTATLQPERLELDYAVWDGGRRGTNEYKAFLAEHEGREVTTAADMEKAQVVAAAVWSHPVARRVLRGGKVEKVIKWIDPHTHIRCVGRPDHIRGGALTDLKSTRDVDARAFGRSCLGLGVHGQMAFYRRGMFVNGVPDGPTRLIAVEQEPPHEVAVFTLDPEVMYVGELLIDKLLHQVKQCRRRERWPGRYEDEMPLQLPAWALPADSDYSDAIEVLSS